MSNIIIQNVTDVIGDAYKSWEPGSQVIIPSYVGSGKTHFIFSELVKQTDENNKLVYLCNRKALLDQVIQKNGKKLEVSLEEEFEQDCYIYNENVYILSYQYCETTGNFPDIQIPKSKLFPNSKACEDEKIAIDSKTVKYFVFDEAHYFSVDSAFNNNCSFWSSKLSQLNNSISIFMTATPEPLYCFLEVCKNAFLQHDIKNEYLSSNETKNNIKDYLSEWGKKESLYKNKYDGIDRQHPSNATPVSKTIYTIDDISPILQSISANDSIYREISKGIHRTGEQVDKGEYWDYFNDIFTQTNDEFKLYSYINGIVLDIIKKYEDTYTEYRIDRSYDNYNCFYFQEYEDLYKLFVRVEKIKNKKRTKQTIHDEKFIIFVDSEADGYFLEGILNAICTLRYEQLSSKYITPFSSPYAVFLSKKTIEKKRSPAYREYKNIVDEEQFNCKILICTKVLDCGVNIAQKCDVENIIITQTNKTEFIQMLGRVRTINHGECDQKIKNVNLYIRSIAPKIIKSGSFQRIGEIATAISFIKASESNRGHFYRALENHTLSPVIKVEKLDSDSEDKPKLSINKAYFALCLYEIYLYYGFLCKNANFSNPKIGYLIEQLNWLGKKYDPEKWVMVEERKKEIADEIKPYLEIERSNDRDQHLALKAFVLERLLKFPDVILPSSFLQGKSNMIKGLKQYRKSRIAGDEPKRRIILIRDENLSKVLEYLKIPYRFKSWKANSKNWWRVFEVEATADVEITTDDK